MATTPESTSFHNLDERLLVEINAKDDLELKPGDTLDVKASILLAAIALMASQTLYFWDKHDLGWPRFLIVAAALALSVATVCAFFELWPRTYMRPVPETSGIDRANELRDFYSNYPDVESKVMLAEFTKDQIGWAQERIAKNRLNNQVKSDYLLISFYCTAAAMLFNIVTLIIRLF